MILPSSTGYTVTKGQWMKNHKVTTCPSLRATDEGECTHHPNSFFCLDRWHSLFIEDVLQDVPRAYAKQFLWLTSRSYNNLSILWVVVVGTRWVVSHKALHELPGKPEFILTKTVMNSWSFLRRELMYKLCRITLFSSADESKESVIGLGLYSWYSLALQSNLLLRRAVNNWVHCRTFTLISWDLPRRDQSVRKCAAVGTQSRKKWKFTKTFIFYESFVMTCKH
jgi:hypothetical protein